MLLIVSKKKWTAEENLKLLDNVDLLNTVKKYKNYNKTKQKRPSTLNKSKNSI